MSKIPHKAFKRKSLIKDLIPVTRYDNTITYSFVDFDNKQSQSFHDWQKCNLLADAIKTLHDYGKLKMEEAFGRKFKMYTGFPKDSLFEFPKYITKDAQWLSMHVKGKPCIAGHRIGNVFYIVFLDKEHKFYPTEK